MTATTSSASPPSVPCKRSRHVMRMDGGRNSSAPAADRPGNAAATGASGGKPRAARLSRVLLGNDSWEVFEGIPKHFTLRARVRMKLKASSLGVAWEFFQTAFALVVSALYVRQTYDPAIDTDAFDLAALVVFSIDYLLNFYCCDNRLRFVLTFISVMDVLTIVPSIVDHINRRRGHSALPFLRFIRVLRLLRLVRLLRAAGSRSISAVHKQIQTIVLLLTSIVFIAAGVFHAVESDNRRADHPTLTYGEALYFVLVTLATVGYGDIVPLTAQGKAVAAAMIVITFTVLPRELSRLNQLMALQSQFRKVYQPVMGNPHILIVGHVSEPRCLLDFFRELYHPDRLLETGGIVNSLNDLPCVIVAPEEPHESVVDLLEHPMLQGRVSYIKGSVMSEEDLCRVGADIARACFVFVSKSSADVDRTDQETVLRLLAVRNYNPALEIYAQVVSPVHAQLISEADADHVICLDQIKQSLMAKSVLCPGLVALVSNLFQSSVVSTTDKRRGWEREYVEGLALEVYATALPPAFTGLSFNQTCDVLYRISNGEIILLGVYERGRLACSPASSPPPSSSPAAKRSALPALKVRPVLERRNSRKRSAPGSSMFVNPGSTMAVGPGQIFYVMSESKKLAQTSSILRLLHEWQSAGNVLPARAPFDAPRKSPAVPHPLSSAASSDDREARADLESISARVARRSTEDVVIQDTSSAKLSTAGAKLSNHVIVVSDLDHVSMESFLRMLRLPRHSPGDDDYHAVIFLSWSTTTHAAMAAHMLQSYDDAFLMLASRDSKSELLRADILSAKACVLLADKAAIQHLDGEVVDGRTILHYLAILSIQEEFDVDLTSAFVPLMELTIPRTMKILDMEMRKHLKVAMRQRQQQLERDGGSDDEREPKEDLVKVIESENNRHLRKLKRGSSKNIVRNMYLQGADNISSLETHLKMQQRVQYRRSMIRRQQALVEKAYFESGGTSMLPFFAAGFGFSVDVFDNILCQSFFTPGLIRFIYELLFSDDGRSATRDGVRAYTLGAAGNDANHRTTGANTPIDTRVASSLVQIPVPPPFVGRTFGDMFTHLVANENIVAIGLYRRRGLECVLPYVVAGPSTSTTLVADDRVFVLAQPAALKREKESRAAR